MFIGHFAPAFAARAITDEAPNLGILFIAAQFIDWVFFTLALVGVEHLRIVPGITRMNDLDLYFMPYSHSLVATAFWAFAFGAIVRLLTGNPVAAIWAGMVVLSHWVLDLLVHRPDLTIAGGQSRLGLGLWNAPLLAIVLELSLLLLAFSFYIRRTKGPIVPPLILLGTLLAFQAIDWWGGEPPASGITLSLTALAAFAAVTALAFWVESTRWHKNTVGLAVASVRR